MTDNKRFIHVCRDNNLRWRWNGNESILEQRRYTNYDKDGKWLDVPETKWIPLEYVGNEENSPKTPE